MPNSFFEVAIGRVAIYFTEQFKGILIQEYILHTVERMAIHFTEHLKNLAHIFQVKAYLLIVV